MKYPPFTPESKGLGYFRKNGIGSGSCRSELSEIPNFIYKI